MIFLSDIRATELKLAGCRGYAMLRPSGIQNENITPMTLILALIQIQFIFGKLLIPFQLVTWAVSACRLSHSHK